MANEAKSNGRGRGVAANTAEVAAIGAPSRGKGRGSSVSKGRGRGSEGSGVGRGAQQNPFGGSSKGRGGTGNAGGVGRGRAASVANATKTGNSPYMSLRCHQVLERKKKLGLNTGGYCAACFGRGHLWTSNDMASCTNLCLFCSKPVRTARHSILECPSRPKDQSALRAQILKAYPYAKTN